MYWSLFDLVGLLFSLRLTRQNEDRPNEERFKSAALLRTDAAPATIAAW